MARPKKTEAQKAIDKLVKKGFSQAEIARRVGRDSSLISQAAKGKKPVENLLPALKALGSKKTAKAVQPPARRTTRAGAPVKVRQPKWVGEVQGVFDKKGRLLSGSLDGISKADIKRMLAAIRVEGGALSFTMKAHGYKKYRQLQEGDVDVQVFEDGIDAAEFRFGDEELEEALIETLLDVYDVEKVDYLTDIQINVVY